MCIGIIYDHHANDVWHRMAADLQSVKAALRTIKLPLPIACIYDTKKGTFVEFNEQYLAFRNVLLEYAKSIQH